LQSKGDFPFVISNFSFVIAGTKTNHRLESGLVRLAGRGTSALSKRETTNGHAKHVYQWNMKNFKYEMENFGFNPIPKHKVVCPR